MATRAELYDALRNADKAGDAEGAAKLASYIQSMPAEDKASEGGHQALAKRPEPPSLLKRLAMAPVGGAEMLWQGVTGAAASIPAAAAYGGAAVAKAAGADVDPSAVQGRVQGYLTHHAISDSAQAGDAALANTVRPIVEPIARKYGEATEAVAARSPMAGEMMRAAPGAFQAASSLVPGAAGIRAGMAAPFKPRMALANVGMTAEKVLERQAASRPQNMGAAAAAVSLQKVSPEFKAAVVRHARANGGAVNEHALARQAEAESLPIRTQLSEGQALGDETLISKERNDPSFAPFFAEQGKALKGNLQKLRESVGPEVFSADHIERGDTYMGAYEDLDQVRNTEIRSAYDDLVQAAGGGHFPIGAKTLLENTESALKKALKTGHAPPHEMALLREFAASPGSMSFEDFETLRSNLATIQRSATSGLERQAAKIMRKEMEALPLAPGAARLKPLADRARALAKARFDAIEADPAYEAVVDGSVKPDDFERKFVIGGKRDDLTRMRENIGGDEQIQQTMSVSALEHLRQQAAINAAGEGQFAARSFEKAVEKLSPRMRFFFKPEHAETVEALARTARLMKEQPEGNFINNSKTLVAAAAEIGKDVASDATRLIPGFGPNSHLRKQFENRQVRKNMERATAPGAGLGRLDQIAEAMKRPQ